MSNFLYNGIELPALPSWDKSTYPVAVISEVLSAGQSMYAGAKYILALGKYILWQGAKCYVMNITGVYRYDGTAWVWHYGSGTVSNQDIVAANYFEAVWTNTNIPTADGVSVYLPKSDPVAVDGESGGESGGEEEETPTPEYTIADVIEARKRGFIAGFLTGINIRGALRKRTIEEPAAPTAYLYGTPSPTIVTYNGVELPELPEWDKSVYPYAYVYINTSGVARLECHPEAKLQYGTFTLSGKTYTIVHFEVNAGEKYDYLKSSCSESGAWEEFAVQTIDRTGVSNGYTMGYTTGITWSNTDIPNVDDGTVYLAASDPVYTNSGNVALADGDGYTLYNGAVLPPLPEWDKEKYPYALILQYKDYVFNNHTFVLYLMKDISERDTTDPDTLGNTYENIYYHAGDIQYTLEYDNGELVSGWGEPTELTDSKKFIIHKTMWTNTDIVLAFDTSNGAAGTVKYAASEPIPLASSEPIRYEGDIPVYERYASNDGVVLGSAKLGSAVL